MKTATTLRWALAVVIATATLLATAGVSYADRRAGNDRNRAQVTRDDHRDWQQAGRGDRDRNLDRRDNDRWGRYQGSYYPPITVVRSYRPYLCAPTPNVVVIRSISVPYLFLDFNFRW